MQQFITRKNQEKKEHFNCLLLTVPESITLLDCSAGGDMKCLEAKLVKGTVDFMTIKFI
jgi:hypothetical protein